VVFVFSLESLAVPPGLSGGLFSFEQVPRKEKLFWEILLNRGVILRRGSSGGISLSCARGELLGGDREERRPHHAWARETGKCKTGKASYLVPETIPLNTNRGDTYTFGGQREKDGRGPGEMEF